MERIVKFLERLYEAGYITKLEMDDLKFQPIGICKGVVNKRTTIEDREVSYYCGIPKGLCYAIIDNTFKIDDNLEIFVP